MTTIEEALLQTSFHDASLVDSFYNQNNLHFEVQTIYLDLHVEDFYTAYVVLRNVVRVSFFQEIVPVFMPLSKDAEILQFNRNERRVELILTWCWYQPSQDEFAIYTFDFEEFEMTSWKQDGLLTD